MCKVEIDRVLTKNNYFNKNQFECRNELFTNDAFYYSTNIIFDKLDLKKQVIGMLLDLKKTFDSVDHNILIK